MASDDVQGIFAGFDGLRGKLRLLSDEGQSKSAKFAGRKAADVLRAAVSKEAASVDDSSTTNSIEENIASRFSGKHFKRTGDVKYRIGVRGGASSRQANERNPGGDTFYWRFLNFGTQNMPQHMSLERGAQKSESEVFQTFRIQYGKAIDRALKRAKKARK